MLTRLGWMINITMPNLFKTGLSKAEILRFFDFSNDRRRHLLFIKLPNFLFRGSRLMSMSNFGKIGQSVAKILRFFKKAGDAILDVLICEISLTDSVWKAQSHHRAKCRQNWSSVVETLQFFEFSKWLVPPSWIFEIAKFYWLFRWRGSDTSAWQTVSKSVTKILRFFGFSRWRPPPSWIVNSQNFIGWQWVRSTSANSKGLDQTSV